MMTLRYFEDRSGWLAALSLFMDVVDELPLHYFTHLMHGAQILAYKHPDLLMRMRWFEFYESCCNYLHMPIEREMDMDERLSDFGRELEQEYP